MKSDDSIAKQAGLDLSGGCGGLTPSVHIGEPLTEI